MPAPVKPSRPTRPARVSKFVDDEEEENPKKSKKAKARDYDDDEEDETPRKKKRVVDEDDEDDEPVVKKKKKKVVDEDDDDDNDFTKPAAKKSVGAGWGAVTSKAKETKLAKERAAAKADTPREFRLKDGETAKVQFLDDEPVCIDVHNVKDKRGYWGAQPCQLATQKHCLMCQAKIRASWKAYFRVLDFRGDWDSDKKRFKNNDKPVEKLWGTSATVAQQIRAQQERRGKDLTELVFNISRTGSGAKDTTYNFEQALDEDTDRKIKPIAFSSKHRTDKLVKPLDDDALEAMGFEADED